MLGGATIMAPPIKSHLRIISRDDPRTSLFVPLNAGMCYWSDT